MIVTLRDLNDADLEQLFEWERDPVAVALAAFTRADPSDRAAFDAHYERIRNDHAVTSLAVDDDGILVGSIASFTIEGDREVSYWIDRSQWGRGIATAALEAFLSVEPTRPLFARVAEHNHGSARVLNSAGFEKTGIETSFAAGLGRDCVEHIYRFAG
ncbi:MAG: GNAT family N-acetyltransferase [Microbacteriaceae bacterium]